jgi:hypothetical protein
VVYYIDGGIFNSYVFAHQQDYENAAGCRGKFAIHLLGLGGTAVIVSAGKPRRPQETFSQHVVPNTPGVVGLAFASKLVCTLAAANDGSLARWSIEP